MAHTRFPIRSRLSGACNRFKVDNNIVAKYLTLCHDIEVIAISVLVGATHFWTPLLVTVVWAEVGDHDDDALASSSTGATTVARWVACRGEVITFSAPGTAPGSTGCVEEGLGSCGGVYAAANAEL